MGPTEFYLAGSLLQLAHGAMKTKRRPTYRTTPLKLLQLQFEAKNNWLMPSTNCMRDDHQSLDQTDPDV